MTEFLAARWLEVCELTAEQRWATLGLFLSSWLLSEAVVLAIKEPSE